MSDAFAKYEEVQVDEAIRKTEDIVKLNEGVFVRNNLSVMLLTGEFISLR